MPSDESAIDGIQFDSVSIDLVVRDRRSHEIAVPRLALVGCNEAPTVIDVTEAQLLPWNSLKPVDRGPRRVTIPAAPAQKWVVHLKFAGMLSGCQDTFEADVVIDGVKRTHSIPLHVSIEEWEE